MTMVMLYNIGMRKQLKKDMKTWAGLYTNYIVNGNLKLDEELYNNVNTSWESFFKEALFCLGCPPWFSKTLREGLYASCLNNHRVMSQSEKLVDFVWAVYNCSQSFNMSSILCCNQKYMELMEGR